MKVTIQKIADIAGVSRGTVDKVIHSRPGVSDQVRKNVQKIADDLGYHPNKVAKALRTMDKKITLAVIMPHLTNPFFQSLKKGMDEACEKLRDYGITLQYYYSDGVNSEEIIAILNFLKTKDIQGLAVRGVQNEALDSHLKNFIERQIPIVTFDSDLPSIQRLCFVGEEHEHSGRIGASLLGKCIGGKGTVAILTGSTNVQAHLLRINGFQNTLHELYPGISIVEIAETLDQSAIAYDHTARLLNLYPHLSGIFNTAGCSGDIAKALTDAKKTGEVKLVTYNVTPEVVELVKNRTVDFTIGLGPKTQGSLTIETLFNYVFFHESPADTFLRTPICIGIEENIDTLQ